jgi:anthranilate synthase/aminodeoxychorismate synthase-like glutamine amidotransferase
MKTLVIDNIDSFVYNLVQYAGMLGAEPIVLQNNVDIEKVRETIKNNGITHIIISPGPKSPKDAGVSNQIIKEFGPQIPILGVCLGHQCIGYVYGATISVAKTLMHGKKSTINHNNEDIYSGLPNPIVAGRYHSLVINEKNLPDCLEVTARSIDDNEIMGVKHKKYPVYGVQFHPESVLTPDGMKIIKNFLEVKG